MRFEPVKGRETNSPRDRPRKFYEIVPTGDGLVDVYLAPDVVSYDTDIGIREYDMTVRVVRGIVPWPGIEEDIRARPAAGTSSRRRRR